MRDEGGDKKERRDKDREREKKDRTREGDKYRERDRDKDKPREKERPKSATDETKPKPSKPKSEFTDLFGTPVIKKSNDKKEDREEKREKEKKKEGSTSKEASSSKDKESPSGKGSSLSRKDKDRHTSGRCCSFCSDFFFSFFSSQVRVSSEGVGKETGKGEGEREEAALKFFEVKIGQKVEVTFAR